MTKKENKALTEKLLAEQNTKPKALVAKQKVVAAPKQEVKAEPRANTLAPAASRYSKKVAAEPLPRKKSSGEPGSNSFGFNRY